jgi:hypothetical protein
MRILRKCLKSPNRLNNYIYSVFKRFISFNSTSIRIRLWRYTSSEILWGKKSIVNITGFIRSICQKATKKLF